MRVISSRTLVEFAVRHPEASVPLQMWRTTIGAGSFANFATLRQAVNATDRVGDFYVSDIGGNKFRLVAAAHFNVQKLNVRHVLTHKEYDKWKP
ncbi:MAG TPA: type II toxin-antitoxin system HigB family toxin [Paraburkholderia sp.]|jgi:mRNA interferase HigB|nr:type II toxin-antitoxin system HigB family toxin [Paraburkholderia sp.]